MLPDLVLCLPTIFRLVRFDQSPHRSWLGWWRRFLSYHRPQGRWVRFRCRGWWWRRWFLSYHRPQGRWVRLRCWGWWWWRRRRRRRRGLLLFVWHSYLSRHIDLASVCCYNDLNRPMPCSTFLSGSDLGMSPPLIIGRIGVGAGLAGCTAGCCCGCGAVGSGVVGCFGLSGIVLTPRRIT